MTPEAETRETVWVSEWSMQEGLREGILLGEAQGLAVIQFPEAMYCAEPEHWHRTREAALAQADRMRTAEITRLRARIAELEAMNF